MTPTEARNLITSTRGRFFTVEYVTRSSGSLRRLNGRLGVTRHLTGEGLGYNAASRNLIPVYDVRVRGYRMINLDSVSYFKCGRLQAGHPSSCEHIGVL